MTSIVLVLARLGQYVTLKQNVSPRRTCTCDVHSIPYAGRSEAPSSGLPASVRLLWGAERRVGDCTICDWTVNTQIEMNQIRAWEYRFIGQRRSIYGLVFTSLCFRTCYIRARHGRARGREYYEHWIHSCYCSRRGRSGGPGGYTSWRRRCRRGRGSRRGRPGRRTRARPARRRWPRRAPRPARARRRRGPPARRPGSRARPAGASARPPASRTTSRTSARACRAPGSWTSCPLARCSSRRSRLRHRFFLLYILLVDLANFVHPYMFFFNIIIIPIYRNKI